MVALSPDKSLLLPDDTSNTGQKVDEFTYVRPDGATVIQQRTAQGTNSWILNAASVSGAGSTTQIIRGLDERELTAILNIKTTPTGTTPTFTLKIQDIDPVDETTTIGQATTTAALNATGVTVITHRPKSPTVVVTWTLTGTTPVFPSVDLSVSSKAGDDTTPSVGTKSNVSGSASSVTILAANSSRKKYSVVNDSTVNLYLDQTGGTASTASYSALLPPKAQIIVDGKVEGGAITGIWDSATGAARVTEWV